MSKPGYPLAVHTVPLARWPWHAATCPAAALSCAARTDLPAGCKRYVVRACTADFSHPGSHAQITPIPARSDRMRCTGVALIMSENQAPRENGAGDDLSATSATNARGQREAVLTAELAEDCATKMFMLRADGPHATEVPTFAGRPTPEEVVIAQAAVLAAIGEKGSEKRAHANRLCADGLTHIRCRSAAQASRPCRPRLTRIVCRVNAGPSAVTAPPPRTIPAGGRGRGVAGNGRNRRRTRAPAVGAACADCGSFGGVRGPRAAHRVAGAVAERPPRTRHVRASLGTWDRSFTTLT